VAANLLTTSSTILCAHGGQAIPLTSNGTVAAGGAPVLLESDVHAVVGCPFTIGPKYSPCVRIEWSLGAPSIGIGGTAPLVQSSVGTCLGAEGAPQGVAMISQTQAKAAGS
jgi:hypothetical protein